MKTKDKTKERSQLIQALVELQNHGDVEASGQLADEMLLEYIDDIEITNAFKAVPRWYA